MSGQKRPGKAPTAIQERHKKRPAKTQKRLKPTRGQTRPTEKALGKPDKGHKGSAEDQVRTGQFGDRFTRSKDSGMFSKRPEKPQGALHDHKKPRKGHRRAGPSRKG